MDGPLRYWNITASYQNNWEAPTQLQRHVTTPWEQLPYECRIDWTREGTDILKQRSLEYIRSQPDDNMYYTDGSSDGKRVAAAFSCTQGRNHNST